MKEENKTIRNKRYEIIKKLGQGGFGITYLAVDKENGQKVVIKKYAPSDLELPKQKNGQKKFLREARLMASLKPMPEIARVLNYFPEGEAAFIVMEYVQGTSLRDYLECLDEPMSFSDAYHMLVPVMDALEAVHKKNILHRDLTPDNLLVRENGRLCVIDFGSARVYDEYDRTKTVLLKNGYAPLEQYAAHGKQKPWTDIYALCAVLYEMITGVIPQDAFSRVDKDQLYPPSMYGAEISSEEEKALLKGLSVDYKDRYRSMEKLKEALCQNAGKETTDAYKKKGPRRWFLAGALAFLLIVFGAGVLIKTTFYPEQSQEIVYAGDFVRGSAEAEKFLSFVKENALSSKQQKEEGEPEGTLYTLEEDKIKAYGLPCNQFRFHGTLTELEEYMEPNGWEYSREPGEASCQVLVGKFDYIETDFRKQAVYQVENIARFTVDYDVVNEDILDVNAEFGREGRLRPEQIGAGLLEFLTQKASDGKLEKNIKKHDQKFLSGEYDGKLVSLHWGDGGMYFLDVDENKMKVGISPVKGGFLASEAVYWP